TWALPIFPRLLPVLLQSGEANSGVGVDGAIYKKYDYLIDPHTAVGFSALEQYRKETGDETPAIVASTASPFKFCDNVLSALGVTEQAEGLDILDQLSQVTGEPVPAPLAALRDKKPRFHETVEKDHMVDAVLEMLSAPKQDNH